MPFGHLGYRADIHILLEYQFGNFVLSGFIGTILLYRNDWSKVDPAAQGCSLQPA